MLRRGAREKLKILFVIRASGHFSYVQSIIESLSKRGHVVVAAIDKEWSKNVRIESLQRSSKRNKNFKFEWSPRRNDFFRHIIMPIREIRSYRRYLVVKGQSDYYLNRYRKYLPFGVRKLTTFNFVNRVIASPVIGFFLKKIEDFIPAADNLISYVKKNSPDIVVVTPVNMRKSEDVEFVKAAKKLKVPTAVVVLSWDNLTTKGLIYVKPDSLFVWNDVQRKEAVEHHDISKDKIKIIGSPFFDKWFTNIKPSMTKEMFCKKVGLNPNFPIILYLGSSNNIAKEEDSVIEEIKLFLDRSQNKKLKDTQILIRPHPATRTKFQNLPEGRIVIYPKNGVLASVKSELEDYLNSLVYADVVMGINTSGMLDAIILDKPVFAIMKKEFKKTQEQAQHFKQLIKNNTIELIRSPQEFGEKLVQLLKGRDAKRQKRSEFVAKFIRPFGIENSAGDIAAMEIEKLAAK